MHTSKNSSIKDELDFIYNSSIFELNPNKPDYALKIIDEHHTGSDLTITTRDEIFGSKDNFSKVIDFCEKKSYNVKILSSSLKKIKYGFNPLINFLCWNKTVSSEHIEINNKTVRYFDKIYYNKLINKTKTFNLIWRNTTVVRDKIVGDITNSNPTDDYHIEYYRNKPSDGNLITSKLRPWEDLIEIYNQSLISFVAETEYWHRNQPQVDKEFKSTEFIPFTEKVIMPFLSKSMPIVFGGTDYVKSLKELGLFVFNEEFGIIDSNPKSYNTAIKNLKNKSFEEINTIYQKNIKKIESNYELISNIIYLPIPYIVNSIDTNPKWPIQLQKNQN